MPQNNSLFYTYPGTDSLSLSLCFGSFWSFCRVTQKLRNSRGLYHKTKNPFEGKICLKIIFQLLYYIMTVLNLSRIDSFVV